MDSTEVRELEAEGLAITSSGDTEDVLNANVRWGLACVERFRGRFALAVWDRDEGRTSPPARSCESSLPIARPFPGRGRLRIRRTPRTTYALCAVSRSGSA